MSALRYALGSHGEHFQPEAGVLPVMAVNQTLVRDRFYSTYAEGEANASKRQAKLQKAFVRALSGAQARQLIRSQVTQGGAPMLWLSVSGDPL
jgi:hypothetical protein